MAVQLLVLQASCDSRLFERSQPDLRNPFRSGIDYMRCANGTDACTVEGGRHDTAQVTRLKGGGESSAFVTGSLQNVDIARRQEQATWMPSFLRWFLCPTRRQKLMQNPGSAVMFQSYDWEALNDRGHVYWEMQQQLPSIASAGIDVVWFPPPSDSADLQGYLPGKWYEIPHRALLDE